MEEDKKAKIETLIEKFINDLQEEYQQETTKREGSIRMITVSAISPTDNTDIEKKISNLEQIIKRLQSEIRDMSVKAQSSEQSRLNLKELKRNNDDHDDDDVCTSVDDCAPRDVNAASPVSSVNDLTLQEASKKFGEAVSDLMSITKKIESCAPDMSKVRDTINSLLGEEKTEKFVHKDGLEALIEELKGDIADRMEDLNEKKDYTCDDDDL